MIQPLQIVEESDSLLAIKWSDDTESKYTAAELRRVCPCASCRDEWTGEKILDEQQITDDLTFTAMSIVGRYALNFVFSDNHDTGIFSFEYLNKLK
ncbi:MAG: DUF971 domain-containing protein [Chloracidobacterium sp.]|nr:DUF971 domain-containing protein [Chloracidobacterium sp.]